MNEPLRIALLVEGHGEVKAAPVLVRRIINAIDPAVSVRIATPSRYKRGRIETDDELRRFLGLGWLDVEAAGTCLLLVDGDGDCPVSLSQRLRDSANRLRPDVALEIVVAHQEYEAWLLAASNSLRSHDRILDSDYVHVDPETKRDAKKLLGERFKPGQAYSETVDQVDLTRHIDLEEARHRSRSFRALWSALERVVERHRS